MIDRNESVLLVEREGAIARLTLNRPAAGNALNVALCKALMHAAIDCDEDPEIRCVVLTGTGRLFCAGGDLSSFESAQDRASSLLKEMTSYLHSAISRFSRMDKPLLTAINGPAAGAGLSLAILGDIALAARSAHFTLAYGSIGLSPDGASTWLLPRLIGLRKAQELALTNKRIAAEEAKDIGLITNVVDDTLLAEEVATIATKLARAPTPAVGLTRNLLSASFSTALEAQMEAEARAISISVKSTHGREGIRSFFQKRKPNFE